ncbi:D-alanyl-D-alanine carboxypeptidase [Bacillus cereus]|nr:D-alanyl-D-alanine carboxypeptidase [Bacillus cereus]
MEAILTSYMYIEFDKIVYFYSDYARKDIGGKRIERYVLQKIHCNSNSADTIL